MENAAAMTDQQSQPARGNGVLPFGLDGKHVAAAVVAGSLGAGGGGYLGSSLVKYQLEELQHQIVELQPLTLNQTKVMTTQEGHDKEIAALGQRLDRIDAEQQKLITYSEAAKVNAARIDMIQQLLLRDRSPAPAVPAAK